MAICLLSRKDYSVVGLIKALQQKGYLDEEIHKALSRLHGKYLDDLRYAEGRVRHLRENGKGRLYIEAWLAEQGVNTETIHRALDEGYPIDEEIRRAKKLLETAEASMGGDGVAPKETQRRYRRLTAAGFSREALEACGYGHDGT